MLTISKPLSAGQARDYHREEFANARENYYSQGDQIRGEWHGKLAEQWGLNGEVNEEHFSRLAEGQHPHTGEQLVRHQTPREYKNERGEAVKSMEHRAGWDATFSAPKSVSLTALVGGDERVREAHRHSVNVALDETEKYVQARIGGNHPAETTGKWVAAKFEHDSARPVQGYAAPQLHTHTVFFNMTETANGDMRAVQPQELYKTQQYATAVYRSELAMQLQSLGYEIERGRNGQPEIKGYTREYMEASSPRRQQIEEHLAEQGVKGAGAAQIAAHQTRESKLDITHEEMQQRHQEMARTFGNQPERVVREAHERAQEFTERPQQERERSVESAVSYARERNLEREAVADERELMRDALRHSVGQASFAEVRAGMERSIEKGELVGVEREQGRAGQAYTTPEMIELERSTIETMRNGQGRYEELASAETRQEVGERHGHLSENQRAAVDQVLENRDQVMALEGVAGAGKTTSLEAIREAAEREGYKVEGFAPTSRAAQKLAESGIETSTLQRHLAHPEEKDQSARHFYVVDEASLASTKQMNEFLGGLNEQDRVLLVGDVRQHQAVDAGRPYEQLQESGMQTARLDVIVRQQDEGLKQAVEELSKGEVRQAVNTLDGQGRVHEIPDRQERFQEIAREYVKNPEHTLVISPDNESRREINGVIHREMQEQGKVGQQEEQLSVLTPRQEMTGADRAWARNYEQDDVLRYSRGSKTEGIEAGEYARVTGVDEKENRITVQRENGESHTYDPRRLQGVEVYRETECKVSQGERVQFTAPNRELHVANRELGTVERVDDEGNLSLRMDSGRGVEFNIKQHPHLDHGYAMTSHSSQAQTTDRVLVHVDTDKGRNLVNERMAYVSVSRARLDAQIYTNDKSELGEQLGREASHSTALGAPEQQQNGRPSPERNQEQLQGMDTERGERHEQEESLSL